jgi:transcription initiation factor TFIIB
MKNMAGQSIETSKSRKHARVCSNCGGKGFYEDSKRGEIICTTCGCVITAHEMDMGPEWRAFTTEERHSRARTGAPMTLIMADKGLSTMISRVNKDAYGRAIKASQRAAIYRMRKWQFRSIAHSSKHRNLLAAMTELDRLASQLGIPRETRESAALIYRKALKKRLVRGRTINGLVAASLYLACRKHKIPRQLDEVITEAPLTRKELALCVRLILQHVKISVPVPSPKNLIPRLCSDLGLYGKTVRTALSIIDQAKEKGITDGKAPGGLAAAALYIAGIMEDDRRTQREIAETANVTEVTVRNRYKDIVKRLGISIALQ